MISLSLSCSLSVCLTTSPWPLPIEFSEECDLVFPLSVYSVLMLP